MTYRQNAQNFLTSYRERLETMSEAESTVLAVREVYSAYYREMGGVGAAPEPQTRKPSKRSRPPNISPLDLLRALRSGQ
jgi:hypothetical protein